jgi:hypothetical protein
MFAGIKEMLKSYGLEGLDPERMKEAAQQVQGAIDGIASNLQTIYQEQMRQRALLERIYQSIGGHDVGAERQIDGNRGEDRGIRDAANPS